MKHPSRGRAAPGLTTEDARVIFQWQDDGPTAGELFGPIPRVYLFEVVRCFPPEAMGL